MGIGPFGGGGAGRGGGGLHFRVPPDRFAAANAAAARVLRNTYFSAVANAAALAEFQADQTLAIILDPADGATIFETYLPGNEGQAYAANQWIARVDAVQSTVPGPEPSPASIDARIATYARAVAPSGQIPDARIPDSIMRDAEFTKAAVLALLELTEQELDDLFRGATLVGRVLTITQADGSTLTLTFPDEMGDGVVRTAAFVNNGQTLRITLEDGTNVEASVPAILRQGGGTAVEGNPAGAATQTLQKISIGGVVYSIPQGSSSGTASHVRAGWSADAAVTAAELTVASEAETPNTVVLPSASGFNYLALWRSDADGGDPTEVHLAGGGNSRNLFGDAADLTVGDIPGKLIVSVNRQNADLLSGESARLV